jgi:hypothetical protein
VAARDHHGRAIARADIRQRHNDVALATAKDAMVVVIGSAQRASIAAGVYWMMAAAAPHRDHALVDE